MNPRPLLPWRGALMLALAVAVAVPIAAVMLNVPSSGEGDVIVFAPSSLAPVEAELDAAISASGGPDIEWVFAGSHSLVAQLVDGAPADVLITADRVTFDAAEQAGVTWPDPRFVASNTLVLAVAGGNPGSVTGLDDLARDDLLIGICAPEVPCGRLAHEVTDGRVAIAADTEETSARALTTKLGEGELDAGLIYRTDARAAGLATIDAPDLDVVANTYWGTANDPGRVVLDRFETDAVRSVLAAAGFGGDVG